MQLNRLAVAGSRLAEATGALVMDEASWGRAETAAANATRTTEYFIVDFRDRRWWELLNTYYKMN
jgi:hypothetical protein